MPYISSSRALKLRCTFETSETEEVTINSIDEKKNLTKLCRFATKIELLDALVFTADGLNQSDFNFLLGKELNMCVEAKNTNLNGIKIETKTIKGNCTGPVLRIINNNQLEFLKIEEELLNSFKGYSEKLVAVRGNTKLIEQDLKELRKFGSVIDLQERGECSMPEPLSDFASIANCTSIYGDLRVETTTPITISDAMKGRYRYEGCVKIENSTLENVDFLEAFSFFKPTPFCRQSIRFNRKLCIKNLKYIANVFVDIEVDHNKDGCNEECVGGIVTEKYLKNNEGCKHVYGNLSIIAWKKKPENVGVLSNIRSIEGILIIEDNINLQNFTEFSNLQEIGNRTDNSVIMIIRNNSDLSDLPLPSLDYASIWKPDPRIELVNNPKLTRKSTHYMTQHPATKIPQTGLQLDTREEKAPKKLRIFDAVIDFLALHKAYFIVSVVAAVMIILLILLAITSSKLKSKSRSLLPLPPYNLPKRSKEVLAAMCKDVVVNIPMVWCILDRPLLWHNVMKNEDSSSTSQGETPKQNMIALAPNALVQTAKESDYNKPLLQRVQMFLDYDYIVMIGSSDDITKIVPRLPKQIGNQSLYMDGRNGFSVAYKLMAMEYLSPNIIHYKYEARNVRKKSQKMLHVLFYLWEKKRLPIEFFELMQLLKFCSQRKVMCVSDRRKEVFSLLYLIFKQVMLSKEPPNITKTFQQHLRSCNGAPLDRFEMLFVMRFILHWAQETSSIPLQLKEKHSMWCHLYTQMSEISDRHYNYMSIHPQHLAGDIAWLEEDLKAAYASLTGICSFSEHPRTAMLDKYRMMTEEEKKREANLQAQTDPIYSEPRKEKDQFNFSPAITKKKSTRSIIRSKEKVISKDKETSIEANDLSKEDNVKEESLEEKPKSRSVTIESSSREGVKHDKSPEKKHLQITDY
ncbi:unnamed protein product [Cylicocyclus nassatus]|uniref:Receptor L-domain domain-containing protein n=1 Tax=Cylicocyclus nassatus TaxID=53992 RepID=A0AA36HBX6_CYLNA|nr:unnamed protein product [Cylicocyclus nassatus]